jgi:hypothetical protein
VQHHLRRRHENHFPSEEQEVVQEQDDKVASLCSGALSL